MDIRLNNKDQQEGGGAFQDGQPPLKQMCNPDLPNLSVGDKNLTQQNYLKFKKANPIFILGMSDKDCLQCCITEDILNILHSEFQAGKYKYKKQKILIARYDVKHKSPFAQKEGLRSDSVPAIFVFFQGNYYLYEGSKDNYVQLIHFINKLINPVITLDTESELSYFLDLQNEPKEANKFMSNNSISLGSDYSSRVTKTRVVAFLFELDDFSEELKNLKSAGRHSAKREELRIGLVTDKKIIKKYKAKYGTTWFSDVSYSSIILKRYDGQIFHYDLIDHSQIIPFYWITKKSIKEVEEMNTDTFRIFEMARQPIFVSFVDFNSDNKQEVKQSINLVDNVLKEVAPKFYNGLIVAYADNKIYNRHRKMLGITHSKIPALSVNDNEQKVMPYPQDGELTADALKTWLTKVLKGQLKSKDQNFGDVIDVEIKYMLTNTEQMKRKQFEQKVYEEGTDVMAFLYSTAVEDEMQRLVAMKVDELAQKFKQMNVKNVMIVSYDVNTENYPKGIDSQDIPICYFFPAYHKNPPYTKYLGSPKMSEMAAFIQKNADIKIEISQNLEQLEQIQEMRIKQMQQEDSRKQSMKMIEDELRRRGEL